MHLSRAFWDDVFSPAEFLSLSEEERAERLLGRDDMLSDRTKVNKVDGVAAQTLSGYLNGRRQQNAPSHFDFAGTHAGIGGRYLNQHGNEFLGLSK